MLKLIAGTEWMGAKEGLRSLLSARRPKPFVLDRPLAYPEAMRANLDRLCAAISPSPKPGWAARTPTIAPSKRAALPVFDGKGRFGDLLMAGEEVMRYASAERLMRSSTILITPSTSTRSFRRALE